jgi:hypothetical protein
MRGGAPGIPIAIREEYNVIKIFNGIVIDREFEI